MPGWRKLLTIEVRDVSRPGIFFYVENYKYDWRVNTDRRCLCQNGAGMLAFRNLFFERKKTPKTLFLKLSAPLPSSRSDRI